jgi:hypothetical protein
MKRITSACTRLALCSHSENTCDIDSIDSFAASALPSAMLLIACADLLI